MPWGRLDDQLHQNGKVWSFSDKAFRLWIYSISYCNAKTDADPDGSLTREQATGLCRLAGTTARTIAELVAKRGWDAIDAGYVVHDYDQYGPFRDRTSAERQRRRRDRHRDVTRDEPVTVTPPMPIPSPIPNHEASSPTVLSLQKETARAAATPIERARALAAPKPGQTPEALASRQELETWLFGAFHQGSAPNTEERRRIEQAAGLLFESRVDVDELEQLVGAARERWSEDAELTPLAVARNVTALRAPRPLPSRHGRPKREGAMAQAERIARSRLNGAVS